METRRAFGFLFVFVAVAVGSGAILSEVAYLSNLPIHYYAIIWLASFGLVFGASFPNFRKAFPSIRQRMRSSAKWSTPAKAINAISWAGPFIAILAFPMLYQYLILLGIGLGNMSTYVLIKKYSGNDNREQLIVALVSLLALPVAFAVDSTLLASRQDIALVFSRIMIATAYAVGGLFAFAGTR